MREWIRAVLNESGGMDTALTLLTESAGLSKEEALQELYDLCDEDGEFDEEYLTNPAILCYN